MFEFQLEHIFSFKAQVDKPQLFGEFHDGIRAFFPVVHAEISGPKVQGEALPGGGDWITIRQDGVQAIDVRSSMRTHDGALIYATYTGLGDLGEDGYQNYLQRKGPRIIPLRAAARYHSSDPRYAWLNRVQCINIGEADAHELIVRFDVYALR